MTAKIPARKKGPGRLFFWLLVALGLMITLSQLFVPALRLPIATKPELLASSPARATGSERPELASTGNESSAGANERVDQPDLPASEEGSPYRAFLPVIFPGPPDWPMAGANPQRTNWTAETLPGDIATAWVKPIVPYVSQHVQVVGAEGKVFVSTAAGLYAFDAQSGADVWQYPTELPLGHSPTYDRGYLYVGGMDRKLHKISARNGQGVWTFTAGGGFTTNPVVANGKVYAGSRDGAFYAINASDGSLAWQFQTGNQILQSAAYQPEDDGIPSTSAGTLFFASNDGYAYALDAATGAQVWQSDSKPATTAKDKFPSMGFYSWWPVIYENYVIFTRTSFGSGTNAEDNDYLFCPDPAPPATRPAGCTISDSWTPGELGQEPGNWVNGTATMNVNVNRHGITYANYFERFPHYRNAFFVNRINGQEVAFDIDNDGVTDAAPVTWAGDSGTPSPPIVSGFNNVLYFRTLTRGAGGFGSKTVAGWKVGTPILSLPYSNSTGQSGFWPGDEPLGMSAAGDKIYWNLCCDRYVGAVDISRPNTGFFEGKDDTSRQWRYINNPGLPFHSWPANIGMPSFYFKEAVKYFWDPTVLSNDPNLPCCPAVFWNENDKVGPAAYRGRLFVILGNALVAFAQGGAGTNAPLLPSAPDVTPSENAATLTDAQLRSRLEQEISEIVGAGHLMPSYSVSIGHHSRVFEDSLTHYWSNPAELHLVLLRALPYLSPGLQTQVKTYLQSEFAQFSPALFTHIGFTGGQQRDPYPYPPVEALFRQFTIPDLGPETGSSFAAWSLPPHNVYALWKYAQAGLADAQVLLTQLGSRFSAPITANRNASDTSVLTDAYLKAFPNIHNAYIAGYIGYIELAKMAGQPASQYAAYTAELERLKALRVQNLMTFPNPQEPWTCENECYFESLITYYNFAYLTPELADYLATNAVSANPDKDIQTILRRYREIAPYWMVAHNGETQGEFAIMPYQQTHSLFQALAMIANTPQAELTKYLDAPIVPVGDLYYIDNLVATLEAP